MCRLFTHERKNFPDSLAFVGIYCMPLRIQAINFSNLNFANIVPYLYALHGRNRLKKSDIISGLALYGGNSYVYMFNVVIICVNSSGL